MLPTKQEPNERSGYHRTEIELVCWRKHRWTAKAYSEWGGCWLERDQDGQCPTCGAWDGEDRPGVPSLFLKAQTVSEAARLEWQGGDRGWQRTGFGVCLSYPKSSEAKPNVRKGGTR